MKSFLVFAILLAAFLSVSCDRPSLPDESSAAETNPPTVETVAPTETEASPPESEAPFGETAVPATETVSTDPVDTEPASTDPVDTEPPETSSPESPCRLLSATVSAEKNRNMCEDLIGIIEDNTVTFTVSAPTDSFTLRNAVVDAETDGVSVSFSSTGENGKVDLLAADCSCTVWDRDGLKRTYQIAVIYASAQIPTVSIDTASGTPVISKEEYVKGTVRIDTHGTDGWYLPEGFTSLDTTSVQIKGRGNSTWSWDKKPYKLKFAEKTPVLGMDEAKKWILLSNYADYSLMRNYVAMETTKALSPKLFPLSQYPVNLFLNGEYQGVYTIGEDHEVKSNRIDLAKDNGSADTSFLLEIGGYDKSKHTMGKNAFTTGLVRFCSVEYPEETLTAEQFAFIKDYCGKADEAVRNLNGYEEYLDMDSLVDWFLSTELFYNLESCFRRSCFMTKEPGGKLTMGPIWDYDLAMGNLYNDFGQYNVWAHQTLWNDYIEDNWYCYLLNDPAFITRLKGRWNEVKDQLLSTAVESIDRMGETLSASAEYNFKKWNTLGTRAVSPQPWSVAELKTYEDNVEYIRNFVINRWNWINSQLGE